VPDLVLAATDSVSVQILKGCFAAALIIFALFAGVRALFPRPEKEPEGVPSPFPTPPPLPSWANSGEALPDSFPYTPPNAIGSNAPAAPFATPGVSTKVFRVYDLLWVGFVLLLFFGQAVLSAAMEGKTERTLGVVDIGSAIAVQFFLLGITVMIIAFRLHPAKWLGLRWPLWRHLFWIGPAGVGAMWILMIILGFSGYVEWARSLGSDSQETVKLFQNAKDPLLLGLLGFTAVIVAPICEEVVFRGFMYGATKKYAGIWGGGIFSAIIFACAHGNLQALLPLFILALFLTWLYEKTGTIWAPIAVHLCFNAATVLVQALIRIFEIPIDQTI
jgi:membrane protease YdiL (CAAX protease family)